MLVGLARRATARAAPDGRQDRPAAAFVGRIALIFRRPRAPPRRRRVHDHGGRDGGWCFVARPFSFTRRWPAFETLDRDVIDAARVDGAGPLRAPPERRHPAGRGRPRRRSRARVRGRVGEFGATVMFGEKWARNADAAAAHLEDFEFRLRSHAHRQRAARRRQRWGVDPGQGVSPTGCRSRVVAQQRYHGDHLLISSPSSYVFLGLEGRVDASESVDAHARTTGTRDPERAPSPCSAARPRRAFWAASERDLANTRLICWASA